jgi:hypothetical protein
VKQDFAGALGLIPPAEHEDLHHTKIHAPATADA